MANLLVQSQSSFTNLGGTTSALQFSTQNTGAGNLLVALIQDFTQATTVTSVTDDQGNTWVVLPAILIGATYNVYLAYALNTVGGTKATVTVHFSGSASNSFMCIAEFSGPTAFRGHDAGNTGTGTPMTSATVASTAGDLLIGYVGVQATALVADLAAVGFTLGPTGGAAVVQFNNAMEYNLNSAGGTPSADFTYSATSPTWSAGIAAFFTQTYSISGSAGVAGATVSWSGTSSGSTTADGSGNYSITGLVNGSYTITPSLTNYTFSPTSQNETVSGSNITGVNFTATQNKAATPTFSPVAGTYSSVQHVTISSTSPSPTIYYTTDGSTPTTGSTMYTGPVTVATSKTLKAIATSSGLATSLVGSAAYVITITTPTRSTRSK